MYAIRTMIGLCLMGISISAVPLRADELDLDALIQEALKNNPNLSVLRTRLAAFEAKIPQAGALEDPSFRFEVSNLPLRNFNLSSTPMSGNQFVLSQKFLYRENSGRASVQRSLHQSLLHGCCATENWQLPMRSSNLF